MYTLPTLRWEQIKNNLSTLVGSTNNTQDELFHLCTVLQLISRTKSKIFPERTYFWNNISFYQHIMLATIFKGLCKIARFHVALLVPFFLRIQLTVSIGNVLSSVILTSWLQRKTGPTVVHHILHVLTRTREMTALDHKQAARPGPSWSVQRCKDIDANTFRSW